MKVYTVRGPSGPDGASQLAALLAGSAFEIVDDTPAGQQEIVYDDTPIADTRLARRYDGNRIVERLRDHNISTIADLQQLGVLRAWQRLTEASQPSAGTMPPFIEFCSVMAEKQLKFAGGVSADSLLMDAEAWMSRYAIGINAARVLDMNGIGGPDLLVLLTDDHIRDMWQCGAKTVPIIMELRRELQPQS
jgi:hypothetical protein